MHIYLGSVPKSRAPYHFGVLIKIRTLIYWRLYGGSLFRETSISVVAGSQLCVAYPKMKEPMPISQQIVA